ncbi:MULTISPECIES: TonB-dependent receptor [Bacteroides]|jgi:TonB-linked SusC/RagA family outer membrane protein|uniref:SusC/RagA family TonB-linked outer membrane protein n=1 Tax=Bacteroides TaxID=816 RepID=UPI000E4A7831|nr:TonB-dependent receptor [Bacteroides sp. AF39-11AC]
MEKLKISSGARLNKVLSTLMICMALMMNVSYLSAQNPNVTVTGTVEDTMGPVIGASVVEKGVPSNGCITDIDGNFSLKVKQNATLVISFVGYKTVEIPLKGQRTVKVTLQEDTEMLDEVVVVGYGTMRKKDLTGSVVQINPGKIADSNPTSVQDVLRGTPGLQIGYDASAKGSGASIQLRGKNSLGTDASPLIVLDGMAFYGELSEINPDDIGQIDVLKDASSAAIYGAKAAAGVIIITTKKGKQGKPVINVSANLAVNQKAAYRDYYNASGYLRYRQDWYKMVNTYGQGENGLYGYYNAMVDTKKTDENGKPIYALAYPQGYYDNPTNMTAAEQSAWGSATAFSGLGFSEGESALSLFARRLTLDVSPLVYNNFLAGNTFDWYDSTFRTGINQDYNASISGATDKVNYYLSVGYMDNEGAVQGNDYHAFRSNMKINATITDWLEVGANVNFQDRSDGDIQVSLGSNYWDNNMLRNSPYASMYSENGGYEQYPMSGTPTNGGYNYYFDRQYYDLEKGYTVLNTIFNAKLTLPLGFSYQFNAAPRLQWFYDRYFMSADLPNSSAADRGVNRGWSKNFDWNLNNTITWDRTFADTHHFTVTLVQEAEEHRYWSDNIQARNITPTDALGLHYTNGANKEQSSFSTNDTHYTAASYLGRLFYSYGDRYMFTGTFRRDGYAGFGAKNPWGNFGSVGLGWTVSNEKFMESTQNWLDMLKLRASWGTNGNREFGDVYKTLANLNLGGTGMVYVNNGTSTVVNPLYMDRLAAPNLQWEKTKSWNVGVDFSVLDGRLSGTVDYYFKKTTDMIMSQRLPSFSGFGSITANLGEVQNKGFEIALNSTNIETRDFTWNTSAGFSINKNRINHIYYDYDENGVERDDTSNGWFIGQPMGTIWYYETDGVWQNTPEDIAAAALVGQKPGDPRVVNRYTEDDKILEDGTRVPVYNDNDKTYLGTTAPPIYWNLRNEFTLWKDLTFSFSLYSYMGHKSTNGYWLNQDNGGSQVLNGFNMPEKEYWTPDNPTNAYCRLNAAGPNTGLASGVDKLYNRNFVRLDDITVGYTLPQRWTKKYMIDKIRVTATVKNVCTISGWEYGDPETGGLSTRSFNFGLNITL